MESKLRNIFLRVTRSVVLWNVACPFVLFLLTIVLSVLQFTDSDYPFGIFKLFLQYERSVKLTRPLYFY